MSSMSDQIASQPGPSQDRAPRTAACVVLLVALCAALYLANVQAIPVMDPDESRCALIVGHMIQTGDWIVPHLEGEVYYDKPAPFFWLAAAGQALTGSVEMGGRLVAALSALAVVLIAFFLGRRIAGTTAGLMAGLVLATSFEIFFFARWYRMDMPLAAFIWAALWCFWRFGPEAGGRNNALRWLTFYACCAGATLMKGPAGVVLPGMLVVAYMVLRKQWGDLWAMTLWSVPGALLFLAITAPWYIAMNHAQGDYFYKFFVEQNVERYATKTFGKNDTNPLIFVALLIGGMLPWAVYLPGTIARTLRRPWIRKDGRLRLQLPAAQGHLLFLWLSTLLPLAVFMAGRTRMAAYILPCFAPLGVLIALPIAQWLRTPGVDRLYRKGVVTLMFALGGMGLAIVLTAYIAPKIMAMSLVNDVKAGNLRSNLSALLGQYPVTWVDWKYWALLGALAAVIVIMTLCLRRDRRAAALGWGVGGICVIHLFLAAVLMPAAYCGVSPRDMMVRARGVVEPSAAVFCWGTTRDPSMALYLGRVTIPILQDFRAADLQALRAAVDSGRPLYVIVSNHPSLKAPAAGKRKAGITLDSLERASGEKFVPISSNDRFSVVRLVRAATPVNR